MGQIAFPRIVCCIWGGAIVHLNSARKLWTFETVGFYLLALGTQTVWMQTDYPGNQREKVNQWQRCVILGWVIRVKAAVHRPTEDHWDSPGPDWDPSTLAPLADVPFPSDEVCPIIALLQNYSKLPVGGEWGQTDREQERKKENWKVSSSFSIHHLSSILPSRSQRIFS